MYGYTISKNRRIYGLRTTNTEGGLSVIFSFPTYSGRIFPTDSGPPGVADTFSRRWPSRVLSTFCNKAHPILATCYLHQRPRSHDTCLPIIFKTLTSWHVGLTRVHHILSLYKNKAYPLLPLRCCFLFHIRRYLNSVSFHLLLNFRR